MSYDVVYKSQCKAYLKAVCAGEDFILWVLEPVTE